MCLTCSHTHKSIQGKDDIAKLFDFSGVAKLMNATEEQIKGLSQYNKNILHTHDGRRIYLTGEQVKEIINHALAVIATGVDTQIDIWAIQWPNDYKVLTIN